MGHESISAKTETKKRLAFRKQKKGSSWTDTLEEVASDASIPELHEIREQWEWDEQNNEWVPKEEA